MERRQMCFKSNSGCIMKEAYNKLPIWGKIIVWVILAIIIYIVYRKIKNAIDAKNYRATVAASQTALNQLAKQGIKPSLSQAQFLALANSLQENFQGCAAVFAAGDFWKIIKKTFEGLSNEADIYSLIKAYGIRTVDKCGYLTGDFEGDLSATLAHKMSGWEGSKIGHSILDVNDILKSKSIIFKF